MIIFFDIDETLIDQRKAETFAATHFLKDFKNRLPKPYSISEFCAHWRWLREKHTRHFFEGSISFVEQRRRRIRELFEITCKELSDQEADDCFEIYLQKYQEGWSLFEDVMPCLSSLSQYPLGIISNGNSHQQIMKLKQTQIKEKFQVIVISENVGFAKPNPEIFLAACKKANSPAKNCIYVGDRMDIDIRGSEKVGMRGIWLARRFFHKQKNVETIHSLKELRHKL